MPKVWKKILASQKKPRKNKRKPKQIDCDYNINLCNKIISPIGEERCVYPFLYREFSKFPNNSRKEI